jgi:hypothetical protein
VAIIGDGPGTLGQALVASGINVVGVDPANVTTTRAGLYGRGVYHQIAGTIDVAPVPTLRELYVALHNPSLGEVMAQ